MRRRRLAQHDPAEWGHIFKPTATISITHYSPQQVRLPERRSPVGNGNLEFPFYPFSILPLYTLLSIMRNGPQSSEKWSCKLEKQHKLCR